MGSLLDLLTVANAALDIRCDARYDARTRERAWALWCIALERLKSGYSMPSRSQLAR